MEGVEGGWGELCFVWDLLTLSEMLSPRRHVGGGRDQVGMHRVYEATGV